MSNAVVAFDPSKFQAGIANMAKGATSRVAFMKMDKTGEWTFGADEEPIEGTVFVDPMGFVHGWQCWADTEKPGVSSELLGEVLVPMYEPQPPVPTQKFENMRPWGELRGLDRKSVV